MALRDVCVCQVRRDEASSACDQNFQDWDASSRAGTRVEKRVRILPGKSKQQECVAPMVWIFDGSGRVACDATLPVMGNIYLSVSIASRVEATCSCCLTETYQSIVRWRPSINFTFGSHPSSFFASELSATRL